MGHQVIVRLNHQHTPKHVLGDNDSKDEEDVAQPIIPELKVYDHFCKIDIS